MTAAPWDLLGLVQREVQVRESPQHLVAARFLHRKQSACTHRGNGMVGSGGGGW